MKERKAEAESNNSPVLAILSFGVESRLLFPF